MTMMRLSPLSNLTALQRDLNRIFEMTTDPSSNSTVQPLPLQAWETPDAYTVRILIAGIDRNSLTIEATAQQISVKGKTRFVPPDNAQLRIGEFADREFQRSLKFSRPIKTEAVTADYTDGVLTLTLPKTDAARVVKVQIPGLTDASSASPQAEATHA
jgi:HSP20 family protein